MTPTIFASDEQAVSYLKTLCRFDYELIEGLCTSISFHDDCAVFGGTIRKHPLKKHIIEVVSRLSHLEHLNLRKCKLGDIPELATRKLRWLDLSCNDLKTVPPWVSAQPHLTYLSLGANRLSEVPDLDLPLETLKLHKNKIASMPRVPRSITSLNLYLNPMQEVPVLDLPLLEVFTFGVTEAGTFPELSPSLRWLTLTVNHFESLPGLSSLVNLEGLQLAKNRIKLLPEDIGSLSKLRHLTLYSNNLSELPDSFFDLKLTKLNLACNPLSDDRILRTFRGIEYLRL